MGRERVIIRKTFITNKQANRQPYDGSNVKLHIILESFITQDGESAAGQSRN